MVRTTLIFKEGGESDLWGCDFGGGKSEKNICCCCSESSGSGSFKGCFLLEEDKDPETSGLSMLDRLEGSISSSSWTIECFLSHF